MNTVHTKQRLAAVVAALGVTFSIVWGLASYAYQAPDNAGVAPLAAAVSRS